MPIHGLARDLSWRVDHSDAVDRQAVAKLSVRDTTETWKSYPFGFLLEVTSTLKEGYLTIAYRVLASEKNGDATLCRCAFRGFAG